MSLVNIGKSDDPAYRYKMPKLQSRTEGRGNGIKTVLVNASAVADALHRPCSYLPKYFGYELGAQSKYDSKENKASVNGDHPNPDLIKILNKFIDEYVLCPVCKLPETSLMLKHKKDLYHHCDACGAETLIEANSKMNTFIVNEMTKGMEGKEKKAKKTKKTEEGDAVSPVGEEKKEKKEHKHKEKKEKEKKEKHKEKKEKKEKKSSTTAFLNAVKMVCEKVIPDTTPEGLADIVKDVQNDSSLSVGDRAALALYSVLVNITVYTDIPAVLEKYKKMVTDFITKASAEERVLIALELLTFKTPSLRAYFAAILKFMYDADILSEDVILKWSEEPLKHRFSCITEKYIIELHDAAEPMIDWLMNAEVSGEELSGSGDVVEEGAENVEEEAEEGAEEEVAEEDDDEEEDDDDDEEDDE
ncbi:eukaryotic translation initiation factor 5 [Blastocystis sp. subtype 4]|uniref:eukaryotic translation initiation factor 5 n=1 Tax=Blastocystis sp. subtype 4 TaxID=944170 RepID=UPI000711EAFC|nr:eukaryotic translation initiation factor 5 [Blastocystis sp. subtype 4]KNB45730.1 eukaryotic translation initiation factor 5 [Blastocystis sp. subtype 4]|eukprot:XP_014529173.1 eukaryotic translation initiation factor 5 [Blastocystis sp. subtype 4]